MTEKRFNFVKNEDCVEDTLMSICYDVDSYRFDSKLVELLNELHEENQSSKEFIEQLQEELVLFKEAGANMGIDLNAQITALKQENEQLKQELKRMYDVATLNKAIKVLENIYDKLLSDGSDEIKDARRMMVLKCIEELDVFKEEIE